MKAEQKRLCPYVARPFNFAVMKDNFSAQSALYARYRPVYPRQLYDFILNHVKNFEAAWDCGTGNGQVAFELSRFFKEVFATDISQKQLENATQNENIFYSVQPAEKTDFADHRFDLITVAQAIHWFEFDQFYKEVQRVARPDAIIAVWTYTLMKINEQVDKILAEYHFNFMRKYWDAERKFVDDRYETIPFPFQEIITPPFSIRIAWTFEDLKGFLNTWSALQKFLAANKYNPVDDLMDQIKPYWRNNEKKEVVFPVFLRLGKIE